MPDKESTKSGEDLASAASAPVASIAPVASAPTAPILVSTTATAVCPQCHLPVLPEYYFCPNCGTNLRLPPLRTTIGAQVMIYLFSAALPWIAYLAITKWPGPRYMRSEDPRARAIGWVALGILVISSIVAIWLTTVWINQQISSALNDVGNIGNFGSGL